VQWGNSSPETSWAAAKTSTEATIIADADLGGIVTSLRFGTTGYYNPPTFERWNGQGIHESAHLGYRPSGPVTPSESEPILARSTTWIVKADKLDETPNSVFDGQGLAYAVYNTHKVFETKAAWTPARVYEVDADGWIPAMEFTTNRLCDGTGFPPNWCVDPATYWETGESSETDDLGCRFHGSNYYTVVIENFAVAGGFEYV
jgi:hypothetical protein